MKGAIGIVVKLGLMRLRIRQIVVWELSVWTLSVKKATYFAGFDGFVSGFCSDIGKHVGWVS